MNTELELSEDFNPVLTEYLLALIKVKQILENSHANDIQTLQSYVKSEAPDGTAKLILEREIQEIGKYQNLLQENSPIISLKQQVQSNIEGIKHINEITGKDLSPKMHKSLVSTTNRIVDNVLKENKLKTKQPDRGNPEITNVNFQEILKMISAVNEFLVMEQAKITKNNSASSARNQKQTVEAQNKETIHKGRDLRNIEYGNKGLGEVIEITTEIEQTPSEKTTEMVNNNSISKSQQEKDLEESIKQKSKINVLVDIYTDAQREKQNNESEQIGHENSQLIDGILQTREEMIEAGAESIKNDYEKQHTPESTPNTEKRIRERG
ncbi:MAG: hypothetical protein HRK26_05620 [Rickettsiaceae bacterium H1]|nr:hypothetical protein [Rickettsiaceae bacterium H1]